MKYKITRTTTYKDDVKRIKKRGYNLSLMEDVINTIANGETLDPKYKDHELFGGDYKNCRECHILPDWLLIYKVFDQDLVLFLTRTGTHSDLFR